jgi:hypothetical protein
MMAAEVTIPYERQSDRQSRRMCGAACLTMVYGSFGKNIPQAQIWPLITEPNEFGSLACTTHLMVSHARNQGLDSVAIQARNPLEVLRLCREGNIRVILNHRLKSDGPTGHYSVFVDMDDASVILHDPFVGPFQRLSHTELLELWQPANAGPKSEITGNILIAIAPPAPAKPACHVCQIPLPADVPCPQCQHSVHLQPAALVGCVGDTCQARMWNYICCPACDFTWTFSVKPANPETSAADPEGDPWQLARLFAALDSFCNQIRDMPDAATHPDIKRQLDLIGSSKEQLKNAQAEHLIHLEIQKEHLAASTQAAKQQEEAHRQRTADLNRQIPPLDGNSLGRALLKNLGFVN